LLRVASFGSRHSRDDGRKPRADVVPVEEEGSPYASFLKVEPLG